MEEENKDILVRQLVMINTDLLFPARFNPNRMSDRKFNNLVQRIRDRIMLVDGLLDSEASLQ